MAADKIDTIVSLSKRRGFVFPSSEIYGGQRAAWDYGPLSIKLKENIKRQWWRYMVTSREDVVGMDSSVILATEVWVASGHVASLHRPAHRGHLLPQALPRRPPEEAYEANTGRLPENGLADLDCPTAATRARSPSPSSSGPAHHPPRPHAGQRLRRLPSPRDGPGRLHQLRQVQQTSRAASRPSASRRWASPSATRSRPATSSSAPASSSRWRSSSSSSRARTGG